MDFYISSITDVGTRREVNQDSIFAESFSTPIGQAVFAILCDGMGGLEHGEVASQLLVSSFAEWAKGTLPKLNSALAEDHMIREAWTAIITRVNAQIRQYGLQNGFSVGSTVTALLLTQERYFILNIGDSRAYQIGEAITQLTDDHTVVADEVRLGNMTQEQAEQAPMKNVLTRCVGVIEQVYPDMFFGTPQANVVYLLCSDGFRHLVSADELQMSLFLKSTDDPRQVQTQAEMLVELNKQRGETDNISVIAILVR